MLTMPNHLVREKSPYLLQHAENPVAWFPWCEEAFEKARVEQKPIFLSIGYSTCHWCHVMAHESFENEAIAARLNEHFVSIKVDREERPDVDRVYMAYVQAMTGHGGWPLSAWLTPELKPFYGGTYFPPEDRHGRAGFASVLDAIAKGWATERDKLLAEGERVIEALRAYHATPPPEVAEKDEPGVAEGGLETRLVETAGSAFEKCFQHFYENFDAAKGGFGGAPKFPRASNLNFLFRVAAVQGAQSEAGREAIAMASVTLQRMAEGGIHDHVGGGFHRYSVDDAWFVPHFEKMLYDQAQIAVNYLEARQATGREVFAWLARDVFDYVRTQLTSAEGGFYSAEDADSPIAQDRSERAEGAFYVWRHEELAGPLGADAPLMQMHFGVVPGGNVPAALDPQGEFTGKNILKQAQSLALTAKECGMEIEQANVRLIAALDRLRAVRALRPRPHLDDKIITAWNGLMISAFARGHQLLADGQTVAVSYAQTAAAAAEFIRRELYDEGTGLLYRTYRQGRGSVEGFAEDYAFLIQGLLDLYEATFAIGWLRWADRLQQTMDELFWDPERGGYFTAGAADDRLVLRLKEDYDGAEPAANSVATANLLRLAVMLSTTGQSRRERALKTIDALKGRWSQHPQALPQLLCAVELALEPPRQVVLAGDPAAPNFAALARVLHERLGPRRAILAADGGEGQRWLSELSPALAEMKPVEGRPAAYVCEHYSCQRPVTEPEELRRLLG